MYATNKISRLICSTSLSTCYPPQTAAQPFSENPSSRSLPDTGLSQNTGADTASGQAALPCLSHALSKALLGKQAQANVLTGTVSALLQRQTFFSELRFCHLHCNHSAERCG